MTIEEMNELQFPQDDNRRDERDGTGFKMAMKETKREEPPPK